MSDPAAPPAWASDWDQDAEDADWATKQAAKKEAPGKTYDWSWMEEDPDAGDPAFVEWLKEAA